MSSLASSCKHKEFETQTNMNLISMSTPYMLHLHPVTIPSAVCDTTGFDAAKIEDADSIEGSTTDGMEHIFNSSTQLQYGRDLRLNEVCVIVSDVGCIMYIFDTKLGVVFVLMRKTL